jgi:FdrA protein
MSAVVVNLVLAGTYMDSIALMRLSREVAGLSGVEDAAVMTGTPANREILRDAGLLAPEGETAKPGDLILAVRAKNESASHAALVEAERLLSAPRQTADDGTSGWVPRTLRGAVMALPTANLALISVPGDFAAAEARKAIERGLNVMVFSDNVPVEAEISLKHLAAEHGVLMMGPDCGTAIIAGTPIGFANEVRRGDVGIIGASGTGIQEVSCLVHRAGGGISHAIGTGGRDLSAEVGGLTTLAAMAALERDPSTKRIVLISKPPAPEVVARVVEEIQRSRKPYVVHFLGSVAGDLPANAQHADTLAHAAALAVGQDRIDVPPANAVSSDGQMDGQMDGQRVVGLYSGGTLCGEAQAILMGAGHVVASNAPIPGAGSDDAAAAIRLLDLGADEFTRNRPHPMIDPEPRETMLRQMLGDPTVRVVLLDVLLGYGAHPDPAGGIAQAIDASTGRRPVVIASVTGTEEDPQIHSEQVSALTRAGVRVAPSNAVAAEWTLGILNYA